MSIYDVLNVIWVRKRYGIWENCVVIYGVIMLRIDNKDSIAVNIIKMTVFSNRWNFRLRPRLIHIYMTFIR